MDLKKKLRENIENNREIFIEAANRIWETPETRFATKESVKPFYDILLDEDFSIEKGVADMEHAFVATYGQGNPVIGILTEYDALDNLSQVANLTEKKELIPGGKGHGCGHNLLGIGALSGAIGLKNVVKEAGLKGTIKVFGCPAEESGYGKSFMAREGIFDSLDVALGWHPMDMTTAFSQSTLAVYQVYYHFKGQSSHAGSSPELGRSALDAAELMNMGVQFLREHIIDQARIHYAFIDAGGASANVVQSSATLHYFIRAPKTAQVDAIYKRVNEVAKGAAQMTGTTVEIEFDSACSDYIPNKALTKLMHDNLSAAEFEVTKEELEFEKALMDTLPNGTVEGLINRGKVFFPNRSLEEIEEKANLALNTEILPMMSLPPISGSSDVGDVSYVVPTAQVVIACEPQGSPVHSWQWVANGKSSVAHKGMLSAGKTIGMTGLDLFLNHEMLNEIKKEHLHNVGNKKFVSPIPKDVKPK